MSEPKKTPLGQRLADDLKTAMKAGDRPRVDCIRMLRARVQEREVALRAKHGKDYKLTDDEAQQAVGTYAKQRRDSIDAYREGGRDELADREQAELAIVEEYLPKQLGEEEILALAREAVAASGASSPADVGAVMKILMPKVKGLADGKLVNRVVVGLLKS